MFFNNNFLKIPPIGQKYKALSKVEEIEKSFPLKIKNEKLLKIQQDALKKAKELADVIKKIIEENIDRDISKAYKIEVHPSGSVLKGTFLHGGDYDIFVSFKRLSEKSPNNEGRIEEIYKEIFSVFENISKKYNKPNVNNKLTVNKQTSSINLKFNGLDIDIVPALMFDGEGDHWVYVNKRNKERKKTNIIKQAEEIRKSGLQETIVLLKMFKKIYNIDCPSYFIELLVLEACKDQNGKYIYPIQAMLKVKDFINKTENNFLNGKFMDIGNLSNDVGEDVAEEEKKKIKNAIGKWISVMNNMIP